MDKSVFCIANTRTQTEAIVDHLRVSGFSSNDISVLYADNASTKDFAHEHNTKAPEGTAAGGVVGMSAGAILGWLAGIGSLAIPGVGPLIAAGPIVAALSGAAVGGATGGLVGGLVGFGLPEYEAKRYEGKLSAGNVLISVHTNDGDQRSRAKKIFEQEGAEDIATSSEARTN
jgi:hypothetical protein